MLWIQGGEKTCCAREFEHGVHCFNRRQRGSEKSFNGVERPCFSSPSLGELPPATPGIAPW